MSSTQKRLLKEYKNIQRDLKDPSSSIRTSGIISLQPLSHHSNNDNDGDGDERMEERNIESDLFKWESTILGREGTPFANTLFDLILEIPLNYPLEPPLISFKVLNDTKIQSLQKRQQQRNTSEDADTLWLPKCYKIPHPNISFKDGKICLDILQDKWSPAWTLTSAIIAIIVLLNDPEPLSPLNIDLANLLKIEDKTAYDQCIRYYIEKFSVLHRV